MFCRERALSSSKPGTVLGYPLRLRWKSIRQRGQSNHQGQVVRGNNCERGRCTRISQGLQERGTLAGFQRPGENGFGCSVAAEITTCLLHLAFFLLCLSVYFICCWVTAQLYYCTTVIVLLYIYFEVCTTSPRKYIHFFLIFSSFFLGDR